MSSNSTSTPLEPTTPSASRTASSPSSSPANSSPSPAPTTESTSSPVTTPTTLNTSTTTPTPTPTPTTPTTTPTQTTPTTTPTPTGPTTTPTPSVIVSVITRTPTVPGQQTSTVLVTSTQSDPTTADTGTRTSSSSTATGTAGLVDAGRSPSSGGLTGGGKIAVAVVVPIVAVALLVLAGLFLWRKRKERKDAEELRRKEVEEYGYNPNNDPTLPPVGGVAVGSANNDGPYEMREDGSSGYRGWGTTAVASSGRKASTTLSGPSAGGIGMAYSDGSPTQGAVSDTRSDNPLVDGRPMSTEAEALGAMGPSAAQNRNGDINRGPSNASSSYSAANRSDGSGEVPGFGGVPYNNQYDTGNPYQETPYGSPPGGRAEMSGQPVIRDVQARRNTRIENPSHFPQQSAGISQNF